MTTKYATLTQEILHLLKDPANREKFNRAKSDVTCLFSDWDGFIIQFMFDGEDLSERNFEELKEHEQREIIRICLNCLDEFNKLNTNYEELNSQYEEATKKGMTDEEGENYDLMFSLTPDTLAEKYGSLLYCKSIEELDELFKEEKIVIE